MLCSVAMSTHVGVAHTQVRPRADVVGLELQRLLVRSGCPLAVSGIGVRRSELVP